ncbi:uncharacterized protein LOC113772125 isoform X2 [Coffea eugenioides]|uniref:uncharacterized protein LOC113772125 isoform X2 n=1 Tax=Coffea eugenioides TaxID=49369 RepID=UPI000F604695|nr:uncharacterized protein LOC113772125 isoform X2 [Coffea eugenioides]
MIPLSNSKPIMAISSANLIPRTAIQLQRQVLLIPWVKKKMKMGIISCSRRRDYSNSVPVSSESNGKRFELSKSEQTSCSTRSFVLGSKLRNLNENAIHNISNDVTLDGGRVVESNVPRIGISDSAQTSCSSRGFVADTEFQYQKEREKPVTGLDTSKVVQSNLEGMEHFKGAQTSCSSTSFVVDMEFQSQIEKPTNSLKADVGLDTITVAGSNEDRRELSKRAQTSCSGRSFVVGAEFLNENEKPIDNLDCDVGSASNRAVRSNIQRSELSKSLQTSCSSRSFVGDTEFQDQNENPINSIKNNIGFGTSRVVQSNEQRRDLSKSAQTSSCGQICIVDNKFQSQYAKRIDYHAGLGIGEELDDHMQYDSYEVMEELEGFSEEESNQDHRIQGSRIKKDVEKLAIELLATRAYTAVELRKKLLGKEFPVWVVDAVITDFQTRGFINDGLYAETFSRSRWSSSTWGPRRIKKALYSKGVSIMDTEKAIKLVFNDASACEDEESGLGISKRSMDHLFSQASKQWLRSCGASTETRKSRIVRWLQYRGFNWSIINSVLKKLESHYPS